MSTLDSLIRLHRWQVDEQRRCVADLEQLAEKLRDDLRRLETEQASEQEVVRSAPELASSYGSYAGALAERRRNLLQSLADAERRLGEARESLAAAYQEAKRYEIAAARRRLQHRREVERADQANMDELGTAIHRRRAGSSAGR
ncbi:MAG TPA: flagellar FliJ family protein [Stellaceae bacterium]|nr:flagellar FliJ family protein [Stellaceae bacterium]